ncbi:hypothetical protein OJJOAM_000703 [Cupriavidus sp. H18C1]|uniref:hypothetical protein n=1 Tax=Cupriavidus sp. H18C1 TaxID=3241601 RepID=UPI003BB99CBE
MLHAVTHAPMPIPTAPPERIARSNFGMAFAQTAWKLFEEDRCRIEFAGASHVNSDNLVEQARLNSRIRDRHAQCADAYSRTQAGHELIAAIARELKAQAAPGQNIDHVAHAYTAAATLCTDEFWKAEAMALRTISLRNGINLPLLPSVVSARITPLEDGTGWRINKLMKWHSYTGPGGNIHYMSNLRPVLKIDHQIEFRCDADDPPWRSMLNWIQGRDPTRYKVGDCSDAIHVACLAPALDQALTTMQPGERQSLDTPVVPAFRLPFRPLSRHARRVPPPRGGGLPQHRGRRGGALPARAPQRNRTVSERYRDRGSVADADPAASAT